MKHRQLGPSGRPVSDLCLGTMLFSEEDARGTRRAEAERMIGQGTSYSQIALTWLRAQPVATSVIGGTCTLQQLADHLAAADIELTADELSQLDAANTLAELYPYRLIGDYGLRAAND